MSKNLHFSHFLMLLSCWLPSGTMSCLRLSWSSYRNQLEIYSLGSKMRASDGNGHVWEKVVAYVRMRCFWIHEKAKLQHLQNSVPKIQDDLNAAYKLSLLIFSLHYQVPLGNWGGTCDAWQKCLSFLLPVPRLELFACPSHTGCCSSSAPSSMSNQAVTAPGKELS